MWLYLHVHSGCLTLLCDGLSYVPGLGGQVVDHVVHGCLVFQEEWPDHARVQDLRTVPCYRSHTPNEEQTLRGEQRTDVRHDAAGKLPAQSDKVLSRVMIN